MHSFVILANLITCVVITGALVWAILSPRVHDGIVIKAGLISMALGFGSIAMHLLDGYQIGDMNGLQNAMFLINAGISVVIIGALIRMRSSKHPMKRLTDWVDTSPASKNPL